ncbi:unnamed protein product [Amoebophrya sp. A120]|nr:unnamed protein product [Amoebophrya sp. A120]|eukprot:GSA120T00016034001.1
MKILLAAISKSKYANAQLILSLSLIILTMAPSTLEVTTSEEAHKMASLLVQDWQDGEKPKVTAEEKKLNDLKTAEVRKDDRGIMKVSEIDYGKHEKLAKEIEKQEEIEKLEEKTKFARDNIPPGSCAHDHQKEIAIYEKPTEEKIAAADSFRVQGNEAFKEKNYGKASVFYRKALLYFDYSFPDTEEQEQELDRIKLAVHLNMAACKMQLEEWKEVLIQCNQALLIDPNSVKAYFRRASAYLATDNFENAEVAVSHAEKLEPGNADVRALRVRLVEKKKEYKAKGAEMAKKQIGMKNQNVNSAEEIKQAKQDISSEDNKKETYFVEGTHQEEAPSTNSSPIGVEQEPPVGAKNYSTRNQLAEEIDEVATTNTVRRRVVGSTSKQERSSSATNNEKTKSPNSSKNQDEEITRKRIEQLKLEKKKQEMELNELIAAEEKKFLQMKNNKTDVTTTDEEDAMSTSKISDGHSNSSTTTATTSAGLISSTSSTTNTKLKTKLFAGKEAANSTSKTSSKRTSSGLEQFEWLKDHDADDEGSANKGKKRSKEQMALDDFFERSKRQFDWENCEHEDPAIRSEAQKEQDKRFLLLLFMCAVFFFLVAIAMFALHFTYGTRRGR